MRAIKSLIICAMVCAGCLPASGQYYEIANQLPSLISPALSGSLAYKGFVDVSGTMGVGPNRANCVGINTTQGFQYADWFYMGVGLGVDVVSAHQPDGWANSRPSYDYDYDYYPTAKTKAMIPVFTDFRFNVGSRSTTSFFIDLKLGAAWLLGDSYLQMSTGAMSNNTQFFFKPSLGVRIPLFANDTRKAVNIGLCYQLLTSNDNYYYWRSDGVTLNNLGVSVGFEW